MARDIYWYLFISLIFANSFCLGKVYMYSGEYLSYLNTDFQQEPFYFLKQIPGKVKLNDKIELSFFRNRQIVNNYRYKLIMPDPDISIIDIKLLTWSEWKNNDFVQIKVPNLDQVGGYKLVIEYRIQKSTDLKKIEKPFYVYYLSAFSKPGLTTTSKSEKIDNANENQSAEQNDSRKKINIETNSAIKEEERPGTSGKRIDYSIVYKVEQTIRPQILFEEKSFERTKLARVLTEESSINKTFRSVKRETLEKTDIKILSDSFPGNILSARSELLSVGYKLIPPTGYNPYRSPLKINNIPLSNLHSLIAPDSIVFRQKDYKLLQRPPLDYLLSSKNGRLIDPVLSENQLPDKVLNAGSAFVTQKTAPDGYSNNDSNNEKKEETKEDIFTIIKESPVNEGPGSMLNGTAVSVNTKDTDGNTPLHLKILKGSDGEAVELIKQGANPNLFNNDKLSPLHFAILTRNEAIVKDLLSNGADINLKGNNGYTPLHIASELNYPELVRDLVSGGASMKIRTSQGLTAKSIAKIQNNNEIIKMLRKSGKDSVSPGQPEHPNSVINYKPSENYSGFHFNLPYDNNLAGKRKLNSNLQVLSVPLLTIGIAGVSYLKSRADHFYDLSKVAGTEEMAKKYYNKTRKFDKYANVTIGISIVSAYGLIHSTIKKKAVSSKMKKAFNN